MSRIIRLTTLQRTLRTSRQCDLSSRSLILVVLYAVGHFSQSLKTDPPLPPRALITIKVRSDGAGVKDAGGAGAVGASWPWR